MCPGRDISWAAHGHAALEKGSLRFRECEECYQILCSSCNTNNNSRRVSLGWDLRKGEGPGGGCVLCHKASNLRRAIWGSMSKAAPTRRYKIGYFIMPQMLYISLTSCSSALFPATTREIVIYGNALWKSMSLQLLCMFTFSSASLAEVGHNEAPSPTTAAVPQWRCDPKWRRRRRRRRKTSFTVLLSSIQSTSFISHFLFLSSWPRSGHLPWPMTLNHYHPGTRRGFTKFSNINKRPQEFLFFSNAWTL